jgi:ribosomal protein S18 acetylase RimI-like enzyme
MNLIIRTASANDVETLHAFEQGVINAERDFDVTIKKNNTFYYDLKAMLRDPDVKILVAQSGTEIIGCGYARIENAKPFFVYNRYSYLGFMYVKPEYRGKGVNQKIIEALQQWSLEKGIAELRLQVYNENIAAIKAYEKAGFLKLIIEMRKCLE